jgi:Domain of unknown function (DUF1707)/2TM domain
MDRDPGDQRRGDERRASLRAADADREQFVAALRQHHVDGRLTAEELAERTERAYAARTFGDLDALSTDLPPIRPPAPAPGPERPSPAPLGPAPGGPAPPPGGPASPDLPPRLRPPGPERAAAKAALVRSILWFGMLSVVLLVVWLLSGRNYFWPVWPILGFMFVLAWQAINLWYWPRRFDDDRRRPGDR